MPTRTFVLVLAFLLAGLTASGAPPAPPQDLTLTMDDGVTIACSFLPSQAPLSERPAAGWPAVILFGARGPEPLPFVELVAAAGYTTLTCDPRGQGASGGLFDLDGPRSIADVRQEFDWLASQPDVDGKHIGAWGSSLGGGAILNSVLAGVPWVAVEVAETWVDLYRALAPNDLVK
ncbi:MAG TPA: CocE/NonD family hydrolase, partial [Gaiellaceae bacterium]|nr:CocE/NonD family hydrolase [Gaiellaceae bacterium]